MNNNNKIVSIFLILSAISSFFLGFYLNEISMGAGGYEGDFKFVKKSIFLFSQNSILDSIKLFSESSNRPPLIYILHKLLNPFILDELGFRVTVFCLSLIAPILFYLCLKERFKSQDEYLLILLASILFFNPYFRTSSFWGLEENYAIICALAALLFLLKLFNPNKKSFSFLSSNIFLITLFSSLTIYFDQKFLIIPIICFFKIMFSNQLILSKLMCIFFYTIFSIPYLLLIKLWGGIFPSNIYHIGNQFYFHHFGYALTMIAFIFFPFIFLKEKNIKKQIKDFFQEKNFLIYLIIIITLYLVILFFFYNDNFLENKLDGGGIFKKISLLLIPNLFYKKIFIFFSIFVSWFFIFLFIDKNKINFLLILYFLSISVIILPFYQEYFDPIVFILIFFVFNINLKLTYRRVYFFYSYFVIFLIGTNAYYN
jgi:hypothetical protein